MIAIAWLLLGWLIGWLILRPACGGSCWLLRAIAGPAALARLGGSPWPQVFFQLAAPLWTGLLPLTWLTYGLAALAARLLPLSIHPLLAANILIFTAAIAGLTIWQIRVRRRQVFSGPASAGSWSSLVRTLREPNTWLYLLALALWIVLAITVMAGTFSRSGTLYKAGYSVFSDFAPHTALVRSFSEGRNWPTEYPHFANDGISYHFMFFFLCGNLNYLGLPLDVAINLPSILGFVTFCLLLGCLALALTGRRATLFWAPALLFFRSSWAFFTFLGDLIRQYGAAPADWPLILRAMLRQEVYIGNTPHDDWGLWGINVYANQRHLLPALSIALVVLFLFLPDLQAGLAERPGWRRLFRSREFWWPRRRQAGGGSPAEPATAADPVAADESAALLKTAAMPAAPSSWQRLAPALLLGILLPYFHGSVLISLLLILVPLSVFAKSRLFFALFAAASLLSAMGQSLLFAGPSGPAIQLQWVFGFIAPTPTIPGILLYLLEMSGFLLPLLVIAFWLPGRRRKILITAFCLPLVLAFTLSMTPDVTVNHKYIMISFALANIFVADLLVRLWGARRREPRESGRAAWIRRLRKAAAIVLAAVLLCTGLQEWIILHNINKKTVAIDAASPLVLWIEANTDPRAVFVTAPYHYNSFFLSGRFVWLGHSYYAWSAGYDTASRLRLEQWLIAGGDGDLEAVRELIQTAGLDYLIVDDTLRNHPEFAVNEDFFYAYFPIVASFPQLGNLIIYDLKPDSSG
jgi:hypothetical protein